MTVLSACMVFHRLSPYLLYHSTFSHSPTGQTLSGNLISAALTDAYMDTQYSASHVATMALLLSQNGLRISNLISTNFLGEHAPSSL